MIQTAGNAHTNPGRESRGKESRDSALSSHLTHTKREEQDERVNRRSVSFDFIRHSMRGADFTTNRVSDEIDKM